MTVHRSTVMPKSVMVDFTIRGDQPCEKNRRRGLGNAQHSLELSIKLSKDIEIQRTDNEFQQKESNVYPEQYLHADAL
jgi:hypothetical protein